MSEQLLEFDAEEHIYKLSGQTIPNVTRIIGDQFPLHIPEDRARYARALGRAIHSACALYDENRLDFDSLDPKVVPYLRAWIKFKEQTQCIIISVEQSVHHPVLRYAGTLDRILFLARERAVLDLKRPLLTARVGVQLAAYQHAYNAQLGRAKRAQHVTARYGLQLRADETYRLRRYEDSSDFSIFVASLNIFHWRQLHNEI